MTEPQELPAQRIEVTENGPYRVRGRVPLRRGRIVESPIGESVDVQLDEPLETGKTYTLCRCGRSSTKPFCDDTHETFAFDGTETADRRSRVDRATPYRRGDLELTDDESLCSHAAFCVWKDSNVWALVRRSGDPEVRERLQERVHKCPSGRLVLRRDGADDEPALDPEIVVRRDGSYWVRGRLPVVAADGQVYEVRNRSALCRCGGSSNKPFCDGTHGEIGFEDG